MQAITIASLSGPAPGKKQGTIIDTGGNKWKIWPDKMAGCQVGSSYEITYRVNQFNNQTLNVIDSIKPMGAMPTQTSVPTPPPSYTPAPSYPPSQQSPDYKSEEIACLAIVKQMTTMVTAAEVTDNLIKAAIGLRGFRKWQRSGNIETGQRKAEVEFDDGIPEAFR